MLDPVEVAKLLWQDGLLTDSQLDNGVEASPDQFTLPICFTLNIFQVSRKVATMIHWYHNGTHDLVTNASDSTKAAL